MVFLIVIACLIKMGILLARGHRCRCDVIERAECSHWRARIVLALRIALLTLRAVCGVMFLGR